jgi:drug/metabolite transporter (DMT)-like permease
MKQRSSTEDYILSVFYFFIGKVLVKLIPNMPTAEIVFFRALISASICYYFIRKKRLSFSGSNRTDLLLRGIFGSAGMLSYFYSLQHLPLATATALLNLTPIFTVFLSTILLGEKTKNMDWILLFIAFIGVVILRGFDTTISTKAFSIGILSAIFSSIAYSYIRKIKDKENPYIIVFSLSAVALPMYLPLLIKNWVSPNLKEWTVMIAIGIIIQMAQEHMTKAHQSSKTASSIMHYTYLEVVASAIVGYLIFSEAVTLMMVSGISIILASVYLLRQSHKKLPA